MGTTLATIWSHTRLDAERHARTCSTSRFAASSTITGTNPVGLGISRASARSLGVRSSDLRVELTRVTCNATACNTRIMHTNPTVTCATRRAGNSLGLTVKRATRFGLARYGLAHCLVWQPHLGVSDSKALGAFRVGKHGNMTAGAAVCQRSSVRKLLVLDLVAAALYDFVV